MGLLERARPRRAVGGLGPVQGGGLVGSHAGPPEGIAQQLDAEASVDYQSEAADPCDGAGYGRWVYASPVGNHHPGTTQPSAVARPALPPNNYRYIDRAKVRIGEHPGRYPGYAPVEGPVLPPIPPDAGRVVPIDTQHAPEQGTVSA